MRGGPLLSSVTGLLAVSAILGHDEQALPDWRCGAAALAAPGRDSGVCRHTPEPDGSPKLRLGHSVGMPVILMNLDTSGE